MKILSVTTFGAFRHIGIFEAGYFLQPFINHTGGLRWLIEAQVDNQTVSRN
jgi:hypothetical protein